ncbi:hypothetical protein RTBOTA2_005323 [Rhodotorula toruloides]|uniref:Uncharacterized protein n=1 Tax=Rhodotorula toruloides TaxID=5286 RepID=A0A0K3CLZ3_RHOTO|nr:hypothetical protein RTBOTA2_005323 [Rhodotorula toruloides]
MVALKSKTLSLPHLSLSRTSSPSRPSQPPTPSSVAPSPTDAQPPQQTQAQGKPRSVSPKSRSTDLVALQQPVPTKPPRRSSIGASLAALTSRSSSPAASAATTTTTNQAPKSPSVPAGLHISPASSPAPPSAADEGSNPRPSRTLSEDKSHGQGIKPSRSASSSGSGKKRSKSTDRSARPSAFTPADAPSTTEKDPQVRGGWKAGGLMASFGRSGRGLALGHSQSQPGTSRATATAVIGAGSLPGGGGGLPSPSIASTATLGGSVSGTATPSTAATLAAGQGVQLHQLAESYVGKVSLRLGEAVNKVFLPMPTGPGGIVDKVAEKAEGAYGGSGVVVKGRPAPRVAKAREVGEIIAAELQAALHDPYLLRTLLRSSVLKALSLFLTRLSALLLVPSPSDPALAPAFFTAPRTCKEADSLPLPLRFNLQIVRCASQVKRALAIVADPSSGFPHFVEETLKPWRAKLAELMNRVMGPLVQSARLAVAETSLRAKVEGATSAEGCACAYGLGVTGAAAAAGLAAGGGGGASAASTLGLTGLSVLPPSATHLKPSATSQLRSLSLGRSASPAPSGSSSVPGTTSAAAATAGPAWLRDLSCRLEAFARLVARLECAGDADKWIVSVATTACWKGMLNLSARSIGAVGQNGEVGAAEKERPVSRRGLLGGVGIKKTPSPPQSPPLPSVDVAGAPHAHSHGHTAPSPADIAFVRLLSDLELLEARLQAFLVASLSTPATVLAPSFAASSAESCPASNHSSTGCGLCRTGRTFDDESDDSSDSEDDGEVDHPRGGAAPSEPKRESRLVLSAMREAMQALSAMVVVVRASRDPVVVKLALQGPTEDEKVANAQPMTPSAMFALSAPTPSTTITVVPPSCSLSPSCPTLHSALLTLPPLILLHLLASRISSATGFRLPHEVWALRNGWAEYASELRGFAAGEEWAQEVAWEMHNEVERVLRGEKEKEGEGEAKWRKGDRAALEALKVAAVKNGGGSGSGGGNARD